MLHVVYKESETKMCLNVIREKDCRHCMPFSYSMRNTQVKFANGNKPTCRSCLLLIPASTSNRWMTGIFWITFYRSYTLTERHIIESNRCRNTVWNFLRICEISIVLCCSCQTVKFPRTLKVTVDSQKHPLVSKKKEKLPIFPLNL